MNNENLGQHLISFCNTDNISPGEYMRVKKKITLIYVK